MRPNYCKENPVYDMTKPKGIPKQRRTVKKILKPLARPGADYVLQTAVELHPLAMQSPVFDLVVRINPYAPFHGCNTLEHLQVKQPLPPLNVYTIGFRLLDL